MFKVKTYFSIFFIFFLLTGCGVQAEVPTHEEAVGFWEGKDYRAAFEAWRARADEGDIEAQYNVGFMYEKGIGTTTNNDQAVDYLRSAAKAGNFFAQHRLGVLLLDTADTKEEADEAFMWLEEAAGVDVERVFSSYAKGIYSLGFNFYLKIRPTLIGEKEPDPLYKGGMRYHLYFSVYRPVDVIYFHEKKSALLAENLEASPLESSPHSSNREVKELAKIEPELAVKVWNAKQKIDKTLLSTGVKKAGKAFEETGGDLFFPTEVRLKELAEMGSLFAKTMQADRGLIGVSDKLGFPVGNPMPNNATVLYEEGAEKGFPRAQSIFSLILLSRGNIEKALSLMIASAEAGDLDAQQNLINFWASPGYGNDRNKAFFYAKKFSESGNYEAMSLLALMVQFGFGTEIEIFQSMEYMEDSMAQNIGFAYAMLSKPYFSQTGSLDAQNPYFLNLANMANEGNPGAIKLLCSLFSAGPNFTRNAFVETVNQLRFFDREKAKFWCTKGAEEGIKDSLLLISLWFFSSEPPEVEKGVKWMKLYGKNDETIKNYLRDIEVPFSDEDFINAEKLKEQFLEEKENIKN